MKYKVIGWTNYENYDILDSKNTIGFAESNAIIAEIRKHKYLFSGWHHQEWYDCCVPVLNDGKKRCFSQRGWGHIMASSYGYDGDYDYARFTFAESIDDEYLKFPTDEFDVDNFVSEELENEHFEVCVCKELFDIAKTCNPFYLEDLDSLSSIDTNDTLRLKCGDEVLDFLVADIGRNKKEIDFKNHHLINGKYKIIVYSKPKREVYKRMPMIILRYEANDLFKECIKDYNFNTLLELFYSYDVSFVVNNSKSKVTKKILKRFVNQYFNYSYESWIIINILYYLNDFEFFKEIAYKALDFDLNIIRCFVSFYLNKDVNIDDDILYLVKIDKKLQSEDVLLKAIELNPSNKNLRYRYYKVNALFGGINKFLLMVGGSCFRRLKKEDKLMINLDEYEKLSSWQILDIALLLTYPNDLITEESFGYHLPKYYKEDNKLVIDGINKYQEYVVNNFDIDNMFIDILLCGINKKCKNMDIVVDGYEDACSYIYSLDLVTKFKYNLKEKACELYPILKEYINKEYR